MLLLETKRTAQALGSYGIRREHAGGCRLGLDSLTVGVILWVNFGVEAGYEDDQAIPGEGGEFGEAAGDGRAVEGRDQIGRAHV